MMSEDVSDQVGEWNIEHNDENTALVIDFNHVGDDGVEAFRTAMHPVDAINLALALISHATCLFTKDD
jgi:hypothetical protein